MTEDDQAGMEIGRRRGRNFLKISKHNGQFSGVTFLEISKQVLELYNNRRTRAFGVNGFASFLVAQQQLDDFECRHLSSGVDIGCGLDGDVSDATLTISLPISPITISPNS